MVVSTIKQVKVIVADATDIKTSNLGTAFVLVVLTVAAILFAIDVFCEDLLSIENVETGAVMSFVLFILLLEVFINVCFPSYVTKSMLRTLQIISCVAIKFAILKIENVQEDISASPCHFGFVLICGVLFGCFLNDLTEFHSEKKACILVFAMTTVLCTMVPDLMFNQYQTWNKQDQWFLILTPIATMIILASVTGCNMNDALILLMPLGVVPMLYVFIPCLHINNLALKTTMVSFAVAVYFVVITIRKWESKKLDLPISKV